jgi:hypothetical protein
MKARILIDSGAFSAWSRGIKIDLDRYIAYVAANEHLIAHHIVLDQIPGCDGKRASQEVEASARQSFANWQTMRKAGLRGTIPVVRRGEDLDWLRRYLDAGATYVALSPTPNRGGKVSIIRWLELAFHIVEGSALVHGLAMTSPTICLRFPWASTDSARFAQLAGNGMMLVPRYRNDAPDYGLQPYCIFVTDKGRRRGVKHLDELGELELDCARAFLAQEVGVDIAQVRYGLKYRWQAALAYFRGLEMCCRRHHGSQYEIAHVTDCSPGQQQLVDQCGVQFRLLSYAKLMNQSDNALKNYLEGPSRPTRPRRIKADWNDDRYIAFRKLALYARSRK